MPDDTRSLYRRWRSQTFGELIGQDHVSRTLLNALQTGRVAHAYLFAGPRGSGKTSTARILAKAVNCLNNSGAGEPCNRCEMCVAINEGRALDLIEIDAASNRGIDEIRDLRDKVRFAPTQARYKFYILDEAHMLTNEAFNALLKTLEEPPPHVIFALVTTEAHKIPPTILSRCQRFDFHRASTKDIIGKLTHICEEEHVKVEPAALIVIARTATGSYRDAESLLDQLASFTGDEGVTLAYVQQVLGLAPLDAASKLVGHIVKRDAAGGIKLLTEIMQGGADLRQFSRELLDYLRDLMLVKTGNEALLDTTDAALGELTAQAKTLSTPELVRLIKLFSDPDVANGLRASTQPQLPLELAFLEACGQGETRPAPAAGQPAPAGPAARPVSATPANPQPPQQSVATATTHAARPAPAPAAPHMSPPAASSAAARPAAASYAASARPAAAPRPPLAPVVTAPAGSPLAHVQENWPAILEAVKAASRSVEAFLKECRPTEADDEMVVLAFNYPFHRDSVDNPKNRLLVEESFHKVLARPVRIRCTLFDRGGQAKPAPATAQPDQAAGSAGPSADVQAVAQPAVMKDKAAPSDEDAAVKAAESLFGGKVIGVDRL